MRSGRIRVLFNVLADADNYNAQSLNAREIAVRLDPEKFDSTFFYLQAVGSQLRRPGIRSLRLPQRGMTPRILWAMLTQADLIFNLDLSPASYAYLHLPRAARGRTLALLNIEGRPEGNLADVSATLRKYAAYVAQHADVRIAISDFLARDFALFFGRAAEFVLPLGVDTRMFTPPAARRERMGTVLFVGHLLERKGVALVLEAARQFPGVCFRVIGSARDEFGERVKRDAGALSNVQIEAPMPQPQLAQVMRESDLLLLPSRAEGVPKVTMEAAACGLPSVIFRDYESPSVEDGRTGFQVATTDEMMERIRLLLEDAPLRRRMGAAAVELARKSDWDVIAPRWASLFTELVSRKGRAN
jgi:glycosyltransferase involved in cell wall biosynthesis